MLKAFLKFLGGEPGEEKQMWLLLGKGFFMGVFLATYQVGSESLFIQEVGKEYLDIAFFTAGFLGIVSTSIFVTLQEKVNFSSLVVGNIFAIFAFIAVTRYAFEYVDYESIPDSEFKYLPFLLFVMMGPITAITLLGFWGVFGRMFDSRQSKRIIGGIDTGQLTATIIAFFSIPIITRLPFIDNTYDLLLVSALSSFAILFFTIWIIKDYNINRVTKKDRTKEDKVRFFKLMKDPYLRLLSFFLIFSMGASVFVDYTFYSATETMFPEEQQLNDFLSFFSGTIMIMSFLIQSFVNDIIIGRFGLKVSLMVMPAVLILFTIGAIVSGHIYEYDIKTEEFLLFFMFTVSAKAFTASLKDALESPAFKLFFLPIPMKIRFDIQSRIEGVVNEIATLLAGAAQIGLGALVFFGLIHFSYFIIGLALVVIWLSFKLFDEYKITLKTTLQRQKEELHGEGRRNENNIINILRDEIKQKDPQRVITALKIFERLDPIEFEFSLLDQLGSKHPSIRRFAYEKLNEYLCFTALDIIKREFKTEGDEVTLKSAKECVTSLSEAESYTLNDMSIRQLIRSTNAADRIRGARLLSKITEERHVAYVIELLRDINPEVRMAAMETAGKIRRPEVWPILIENLHLATYGNAAMSALTHSGEVAFHNIDSAFYKTGQYQNTMIRIIEILGRVGGRQSIELLWKKIDFPDKKIVNELLLSLSYIGFEGRDFQGARIKIIVERLIGALAWNIKALQDIPGESNLDLAIRHAIFEENKQNYDEIFMLLGMIYDRQNVVLVKDNIEAKTTDSVAFAVEMLDIFVEEELKPKLFPVMDEMKDEDRLAKLQAFYPPEEFESYTDLLLQIINRDYNQITRYTKALAIYRISKMKEVEVTDDLIANLFNPDPLLLQTAAYTIYTIDPNSYQTNTRRLKPGTKKELDKAILPPVFIEEGEEYHQKLLLIERVILLKSLDAFSRITGELITEIAEVLDEIRVQKGTKLIEKGEGGNAPMYIILDGEVEIVGDDSSESRGVNELIGERLILERDKFDFDAIAKTNTTVLVFRKEEMLDLMSKDVEIVEAMISVLNNEHIKSGEEELEFNMDIL